jgi:hypothetical protein
VGQDEEAVELDALTLASPAGVVALGQMAATSLQAFGTCTFILDEQGKVRIVNHFHVFVSAEAAYPPPGQEPVFVRPVLTNKKPQYVAVRPEDGSVWEVEFQTPVPEVEEDEIASSTK